MAPIKPSRRTIVVIGILFVAVIATLVGLLDRPEANENDRVGDPVRFLLRWTANTSATNTTETPSSNFTGSRPVPSGNSSSTTNTTVPSNPANSSSTTNTTVPSKPVASGNSSSTANTTVPSKPVSSGNSSSTANTTVPSEPGSSGNSSSTANTTVPSEPVPSGNSSSTANTTVPSEPVPSGNLPEPPSTPLQLDVFADVEPNPVPSNPSKEYFNYDPDDDDYGPEAWGDIDTSDCYMKEFSDDGFGAWKGHLGKRDVTKNRCDTSTRDKQSPLDLHQTGESEAKCDSVHMIRPKAGKLPLSSDKITKRIEPNKLSIILKRRACLDVNDEECNVDRPPVADYPRYSSGTTHFSDLLQWDLKIPGEHWIEEESFDAEIQMLHSHLDTPRVSMIGVPIRATEDGFNAAFQEILDQFQLTYDSDKAECEARKSTRRRTTAMADDFVVSHEKTPTPKESQSTVPFDDPESARQLQESSDVFDPYSSSFLTTIYFFRYDGTTTDPPCVFLTWWFMSSPMFISMEQLNQAKYLLFTHVNGNCEKTSVHNEEQSVARPLQKRADDQFIMKCDDGDFEADNF